MTPICSVRVARDDWWQQAMARVYLREGVAVLLYEVRRDIESELARSAGMQRDLLPALGTWLHARGLAAGEAP
jgi:hypothetical protein